MCQKTILNGDTSVSGHPVHIFDHEIDETLFFPHFRRLKSLSRLKYSKGPPFVFHRKINTVRHKRTRTDGGWRNVVVLICWQISYTSRDTTGNLPHFASFTPKIRILWVKMVYFRPILDHFGQFQQFSTPDFHVLRKIACTLSRNDHFRWQIQFQTHPRIRYYRWEHEFTS